MRAAFGFDLEITAKQWRTRTREPIEKGRTRARHIVSVRSEDIGKRG